MGELSIVVTFTIGIAASLILGLIAHLLKFSPIIGYLTAGILLGLAPGVQNNHEVIHQFADIGVILLMFGIGLKFHITELIAVWKVAVPGALIQSTLSTVIAAALLRLCGWQWHSGLILGMSISVASTVVMARVLSDTRDIHTPVGHIAFGWTVVEDILTVMVLLALPMIFGAQVSTNLLSVFGVAAGKILMLAIVVIVLGKWVLPWCLGLISATKSSELFTLAVLAMALGIAVGSSALFGVSIELGAFMAGLAVGRSDFAFRAAGEAIPLRDAFSVLFFVSVGMMFNIHNLISSLGINIIVFLVVVLIKPLVATATVYLLKQSAGTSISIGATFSQIGEFSFILGNVAYGMYYPGTTERLLSETGFNALIATSIITIALNPYIYGKARKIKVNDKSLMPKPEELLPPNKKRCIIVGYGPVGRAVYSLLRKRSEMDIHIIELNMKTVHELKKINVDALYGDVLRPGILEQSGILGAGYLVITVQIDDVQELVKRVKKLNPDIKILARKDFLLGATKLRQMGADVVLTGEGEVAKAMARSVIDTIDGKKTEDEALIN